MRPAIECALTLFANPGLVRHYREQDLPPGVQDLLLLAVGHGYKPTGAAIEGVAPMRLQDAASFYIEQILLDQQADSYRMLGSSQDASHEELRRNMALLMRWLQPDMPRPLDRSAAAREVFTTRITRAWNDLKSDERRAAYVHTAGRTGIRDRLRMG